MLSKETGMTKTGVSCGYAFQRSVTRLFLCLGKYCRHNKILIWLSVKITHGRFHHVDAHEETLLAKGPSVSFSDLNQTRGMKSPDRAFDLNGNVC